MLRNDLHHLCIYVYIIVLGTTVKGSQFKFILLHVIIILLIISVLFIIIIVGIYRVLTDGVPVRRSCLALFVGGFCGFDRVVSDESIVCAILCLCFGVELINYVSVEVDYPFYVLRAINLPCFRCSCVFFDVYAVT